MRTRLWEGTTHEEFTNRMEELSAYVKKSGKKIHEPEGSLKSAKLSGASYSAQIKNMKDELNKNTQEIAALNDLVNQYKGKNETLIKTVSLQQAEIEDKLSQIAAILASADITIQAVERTGAIRI